MTKNTTDRHNDGQTDRAEGNGYNAPHGFADEMLTFGTARSQVTEDNKAYREGYRHADKQA